MFFFCQRGGLQQADLIFFSLGQLLRLAAMCLIHAMVAEERFHLAVMWGFGSS